ncbi:MAG: transcription-repair coupling factor [Armatimonadota bacterium]|nr:transcription-repair coupling factor [Armatimonadota bacterium]MDR7489620.1 transcription-repair coupling factor [Armatimonadota bacterium]MDR7500988.1 transcription-repair coupling factor [Armatimonadota bacterium]MDR7526353.1 transcription-repair coupling factor [Armatimonadota bacterium]
MLNALTALLRQSPPHRRAVEVVRARRPLWVRGPGQTEKAYLLAALLADLEAEAAPADGTGGAALLVLPSREAAERLAEDLALFAPAAAERVVLYPVWETLPADGDRPTLVAAAERRALLHRLEAGEPVLALLPASALARKHQPPEVVHARRTVLRRGARVDRDGLVATLAAYGYERLPLVDARGQMAVRGGIVDVFPPQGGPYRVELSGDEVESLREFDPATQRSTRTVEEVVLLPLHDPEPPEALAATVLDYLPSAVPIVLDEEPELRGQIRALAAGEPRPDAEAPAPPPYVPWEALQRALRGRPVVALSTLRHAEPGYEEVVLRFGGMEAFGGQTNLFARALGEWTAAGRRVVVASAHPERVAEILRDHGLTVPVLPALEAPPAPGTVTALRAPLSRGFTFDPAQTEGGEAPGALALVTDAEILGWRRRRPRLRFLREGTRISSWTDLIPGDYIVHLHHGIGIYRGLVHLELNGHRRDYLLLEYAQGDRLYVPTDQLGLIQRYIGVEGQAPRIHSLGGADWEREKQRVRQATREMAEELLRLYAARQATPGHAFGPDTPWQYELEASFPYEETPDQWQAIQDVKRDMESQRPMDRLIAGDVGYGKTEVAVRAAFKAVMDGKQVAVLVPTTILAQQHYNVFLQRFAPYPVRVEVLSRFRTPRQQRRILADLAAGRVDVVIGTHRLLSSDVVFHDLGLVIIDEEQRFGVEHKERLKQLRTQVDVLTLTATPIPRTLHMSLVGLRDMSIMETPPEARLPIHTVIREADDAVVREAILRELARGGQVYVVHNRVQTIDRAARRLARLVPEARVVVAHGQMPEEKLERVMMDFLGGRYDVLVCTTIVEIGLDIPQVNTIIIEDAHLMGLAQLYQLRGRVGRADHQAHCYLLYPRGATLTPEAEARLRAMQEFVELGSGFKLAMRDLEIRGAGNLLGPEQHGHVAAVGFELYTRLLDQAIRELRGELVDDAPDPTVDVHVDAYLPPDYVADEAQRMILYRRLATLGSLTEVGRLEEELADRFGPLPVPVRHLLEAVRLRVLARRVGAVSVVREGHRFTVRLRSGAFLPEPVQRRLRVAYGRRVQVTPAVVTVHTTAEAFPQQVDEVREVLEMVARLVRQQEGAALARA